MAVTAPRPVPWISQTGRTLSVRKEVQSIWENFWRIRTRSRQSKLNSRQLIFDKSFWDFLGDKSLIKWLSTSKVYIF